jgi:hypothetical protein
MPELPIQNLPSPTSIEEFEAAWAAAKEALYKVQPALMTYANSTIDARNTVNAVINDANAKAEAAKLALQQTLVPQTPIT